MLDFFYTTLSGIVIVIGIIAGIGPQNLNIITHAIRRNHEYNVALTCFVADSFLILLGTLGLKFTNSTVFIVLINLVGIAFLSYYLWTKIRDLNLPHDLKISLQILDKKTAVLRALALTWLNPLVIIDTFVVIGGVSTHYAGAANSAFILGAVLGDLAWIFGLTWIARTFARQLNRPRVWMVIDISTIMLLAFILIKMISFLV